MNKAVCVFAAVAAVCLFALVVPNTYRRFDDASRKDRHVPFVYDFKRIGEYRVAMVIQNGPSNYVALPPCPEKLEPHLLEGKWVVLLFAIYGPRDIKAIKLTDQAARKLEHPVKVGFRPYYFYEENVKWFPEYRDYHPSSPVWIIYENGRTVAHRSFTDFFDESGTWSEERFLAWLDDNLK